MKERDSTAVPALRSVLSAIDNAESVDLSFAPTPGGGSIAGAVTGRGAGEVPRRELSEHEMEDIVRAEIASRQAAAADYERLGRGDDAARLRTEADLLDEHLNIRH